MPLYNIINNNNNDNGYAMKKYIILSRCYYDAQPF